MVQTIPNTPQILAIATPRFRFLDEQFTSTTDADREQFLANLPECLKNATKAQAGAAIQQPESCDGYF